MATKNETMTLQQRSDLSHSVAMRRPDVRSDVVMAVIDAGATTVDEVLAELTAAEEEHAANVAAEQ